MGVRSGDGASTEKDRERKNKRSRSIVSEWKESEGAATRRRVWHSQKRCNVLGSTEKNESKERRQDIKESQRLHRSRTQWSCVALYPTRLPLRFREL